MINDLCFVSVAFKDQRYLDQQVRLKESILAIYPEAHLLFYYDEYPPNSRDFFDSLYGFKVHAIVEARKQGYGKIIWLDPAMILVDKIDYLFGHPMVVVRDDNKLHNVVSDKCYEHFNLTKEEVEAKGWHLVGGSLYYFDFDFMATEMVFAAWWAAEVKGMFGSQTEQASGQLQGHRMDESVMAICMYMLGIKPMDLNEARYCCEVNPAFIKRHFK